MTLYFFLYLDTSLIPSRISNSETMRLHIRWYVLYMAKKFLLLLMCVCVCVPIVESTMRLTPKLFFIHFVCTVLVCVHVLVFAFELYHQIIQHRQHFSSFKDKWLAFTLEFSHRANCCPNYFGFLCSSLSFIRYLVWTFL